MGFSPLEEKVTRVKAKGRLDRLCWLRTYRAEGQAAGREAPARAAKTPSDQFQPGDRNGGHDEFAGPYFDAARSSRMSQRDKRPKDRSKQSDGWNRDPCDPHMRGRDKAAGRLLLDGRRTYPVQEPEEDG